MADTAAPPARGLVCPACGCGKLPAVRSRRAEETTYRVRRCADCGHCIRTAEKVQSTDVKITRRKKEPSATAAHGPKS